MELKDGCWRDRCGTIGGGGICGGGAGTEGGSERVPVERVSLLPTGPPWVSLESVVTSKESIYC